MNTPLGSLPANYDTWRLASERDRYRPRRPRTPDEDAFAARVGRAWSGMVSPPQGDDKNDDSTLRENGQ